MKLFEERFKVLRGLACEPCFSVVNGFEVINDACADIVDFEIYLSSGLDRAIHGDFE